MSGDPVLPDSETQGLRVRYWTPRHFLVRIYVGWQLPAGSGGFTGISWDAEIGLGFPPSQEALVTDAREKRLWVRYHVDQSVGLSLSLNCFSDHIYHYPSTPDGSVALPDFIFEMAFFNISRIIGMGGPSSSGSSDRCSGSHSMLMLRSLS